MTAKSEAKFCSERNYAAQVQQSSSKRTTCATIEQRTQRSTAAAAKLSAWTADAAQQ